MSKQGNAWHSNRRLLTSVVLSFCGSLFAFHNGFSATSFSIQGYDFGSIRNHVKLRAFVTGTSAPYWIYIWATVNNLGEFCYSSASGWTLSIPESSGGTIANGTARCKEPAGDISGYTNTASSVQVDILEGMDLSAPLFDGAKVYASIGNPEKPNSGEYKVIYAVTTPPAPANKHPSASANFSYSVGLPTVVTLDASESYDPDGSIVDYEWEILATGNNQQRLSATGVKTQITLDKPTKYNIFLTVTDNQGASSKAKGDIEIQEDSVSWLSY